MLWLEQVEGQEEQREHHDAWCGPGMMRVTKQMKSVTLRFAGTDGELRDFLAQAQMKLSEGRPLTVTLSEEA